MLAVTVLTGVLQILAGYLKLGSLMRFVSRSVVTGFVNALAILIFLAQLPELTNVTCSMCMRWPLAASGIICLFPCNFRCYWQINPLLLWCVSSSLLRSCVVRYWCSYRRRHGNLRYSAYLPMARCTCSARNLVYHFPYAVGLSIASRFIGIDEVTATSLTTLLTPAVDKNRECKGQGIANVFTGFLGGMAGCAMIGAINDRY